MTADSPKQKKPSGIPQARFQWNTRARLETPSAVQTIVPQSSSGRNGIDLSVDWKRTMPARFAIDPTTFMVPRKVELNPSPRGGLLL